MTLPTNPTHPDDAALDAALRGLHRNVLDEPVPAALLEAARQVDALQKQSALHRRSAAMAASVLLAFGVGWLVMATCNHRGQLMPWRWPALRMNLCARQDRKSGV